MFQVTETAAKYILGSLSPVDKDKPVRISFTTTKGCGDKKLAITPGAMVTWDDSVLHDHGLVAIANLKEHQELSGGTLDLEVDGLNRRLIVRSERLLSCGCGTSYSTKKSDT
ncbi:MAG: hypothetical protein A3C93_01540 [Candidatus Lloydbacteria bacterium RIFCSPHIGHO2_02_FULL_54_17]|uniref:FeS cluster biogenesis domain-containing protein n=1 Tax=Candidatus Lloydbacteria bacterium RIFCSPHIGHO2_02_FULL_54_17 TaxID=1798664 RepID=A0A1G2DC21_9BACT|nr:MAG: hypothetical protein A2762_00470 [Candidatus Lloydbacteria bacterium RIFCSPHIGHO2_01_FULL_54_11]OGZ11012.1 MAG: hypothetical protein A3C93_01540 [Candidatus Lloydbacteria bacterium RIFCSPHIGHO2_02_FULL_54_17]OGZ13163.1 MAG: hypothetical protein A2948_02235 [Candidatus Lloydbacteria bacterium RIFCSPLOWO2_01_FULL_54_18]